MDRLADFAFGSLKIALGVYLGIAAVTYAAGPLWENRITVHRDPVAVRQAKAVPELCQIVVPYKDFQEILPVK